MGEVFSTWAPAGRHGRGRWRVCAFLPPIVVPSFAFFLFCPLFPPFFTKDPMPRREAFCVRHFPFPWLPRNDVFRHHWGSKVFFGGAVWQQNGLSFCLGCA